MGRLPHHARGAARLAARHPRILLQVEEEGKAMRLFRAILRQQERATAARGCMTIILFGLLVVLFMAFGIPLLGHLLAALPKAHR